ncbi:hypothetical protein LTR99_008291 [Exophiala xenobiotica]|uniref:Uncharacterized protein n=1 Tax=Vermiconidia calcicola TaxID=1690605 RepID=A0AAV9PWN8_9PEZI|nr:hypothetical protein LTR96_000446 [Exophiala xenobiotica]KAK5528441.1 hypothetical protein LTR25_010440 [Vermiconidia calcicola]KAK5538285.1 hypothetical protein LTR23_007073 [Chaetothyriales sp. CCFEE 6169]KAK5280273.1 hypothetical protein LTR40_006586 [Exophiala xenobiotica]KAK5297888.1 hypothetical protein LTR99_008291 [Exophiala xenobiotica]
MATRYFSATRIVLSSEVAAADMYSYILQACRRLILHHPDCGYIPSGSKEKFHQTLPAGPHLQFHPLLSGASIQPVTYKTVFRKRGAPIMRRSSTVK